ncbi:MAG: hypothetical protein ABIG89_00630 [Candidatus Woesearchaeota archaeon]
MGAEEFDPWEEEGNVYKGKARQSYVENDEMSPEEEAFMTGYDEGEDDEDVELNLNDEDEY